MAPAGATSSALFVLSAVVTGGSLWVASLMWAQFTGGAPLSDAIKSAQSLPLFAWHPLLMTVGMLPAASMAYTLIDPRRRDLTRQNRVLWAQGHAALMFVSAASLAGGFWAIYQNKVRSDKPHFTSPHSLVGLVTVAAYACSYLAAWRRILVPLDLTQLNFNWNCRLHRIVGKAAFCLAGLGVVTGGYTGYGRSLLGEDYQPVLAGAILIPQLLMVFEVPQLFVRTIQGGARKQH